MTRHVFVRDDATFALSAGRLLGLLLMRHRPQGRALAVTGKSSFGCWGGRGSRALLRQTIDGKKCNKDRTKGRLLVDQDSPSRNHELKPHWRGPCRLSNLTPSTRAVKRMACLEVLRVRG